MLITSLIIIAPALYNRYPLMYFDSGAYMEMSVNLQPSPHRAFGYAYLIRLFGWTITNWVLIWVQGLLCSLGILQLLSIFFKDQQSLLWRHFLAVVLLCFFGSLPWYAAQLMPDIFSFVLALSVLIILLSKHLSQAQLIWHAVLIWVALMTHYAHLPLLFIFLISVLLIGRWFQPFRLERVKWMAMVFPLIASFICIASVNALNDRGFGMGTASNVFLVANLGEMGLLGPYLQEKCPQAPSVLCEIKDELPHETGGYLWDTEGPVQQYPGGWMAMNDACAPVVHDFFTEPKWAMTFFYSSFKSTLQQMFQIELGSGLQYSYGEGSPPSWPMKTHYTFEYNEYLTSVQNKGDDLPLAFFKIMNYIGILLSLLVIGYGLLNGKFDERIWALLIAVFLLYLFHAAITGVLANVYERLQCRVLPLLNLAAMLAAYHLWTESSQLNKT